MASVAVRLVVIAFVCAQAESEEIGCPNDLDPETMARRGAAQLQTRGHLQSRGAAINKPQHRGAASGGAAVCQCDADMRQAVAKNHLLKGDEDSCEAFCFDNDCDCMIDTSERCKFKSCAACDACGGGGDVSDDGDAGAGGGDDTTTTITTTIGDDSDDDASGDDDSDGGNGGGDGSDGVANDVGTCEVGAEDCCSGGHYPGPACNFRLYFELNVKFQPDIDQVAYMALKKAAGRAFEASTQDATIHAVMCHLSFHCKQSSGGFTHDTSLYWVRFEGQLRPGIPVEQAVPVFNAWKTKAFGDLITAELSAEDLDKFTQGADKILISNAKDSVGSGGGNYGGDYD